MSAVVRLAASQPAPPPRPKPQFPFGAVVITRTDIKTLTRCLPKPGTEEYAYHRDLEAMRPREAIEADIMLARMAVESAEYALDDAQEALAKLEAELAALPPEGLSTPAKLAKDKKS